MYLVALNLTPGYSPYDCPSMEIESQFIHNGGEPHLVLKDHDLDPEETPTRVIVTARIKDMSDLGFIYLAKKILDSMNFTEISLFLPYLPGARQDRVTDYTTGFTAKMYAEILNSLNFQAVNALDPHSYVMPGLLNNFVETSSWDYRNMALDMIAKFEEVTLANANYSEELVFVAPDTGAYKDLSDYVEFNFEDKFPMIHCTKHRDPATGYLSRYQLHKGDLDITGKVCVIMDDICDGGRTFGLAAAKLKEQGAKRIYLYVSHGIFSSGFRNGFFDDIERIYTTDSWRSDISMETPEIEKGSEKVTIMKM